MTKLVMFYHVPLRSGIIMLKLKRILQFRGYVYFQAVRPQLIIQALNWLRNNNPLYSDITVDIDNIDKNLTALEQNISEESEPLTDNLSTDKENDTSHENVGSDTTLDNEEKDDPLNE